MDESEQDAKKFFIQTFFADFDDKVLFVEQLHQQGRRDEAMMLCCVYLGGLGNSLTGTTAGSAENFCRVLIERSGEETFGFIDPHRLADRTPWKSAPAGLHGVVDRRLRAMRQFEALTESEVLATLRPNIPAKTSRQHYAR